MHIENGSGFDGSINMKIGRTEKEKRDFKLKIPAFELIGFAFYLGWIFSLFWSPSLFPSGSYSDLNMHLIRITMSVAMFVAYICFGAFAQFLATKKGDFALRILALVLCPMCCTVGLFGISDATVAMVLWSCSGIGSSALLLVWSKELVGLTRKQLIFSAAGAFFIGSFLFLSVSFLRDGVASFAIASLPIVSVIIAFLVNSSLLSFSQTMDALLADSRGRQQGKPHAIDEEETADRSDESKLSIQGQRVSFTRTILLGLAYSVGIGFVGACATVTGYFPFNILVIIAANCIAAVFAVYYLVKKTKNISLILTEVFLPLMLICIFFFSFVGFAGQLICFFFLFALLACHDIIDIASVSKSASLFNENYVKAFAFGRICNGIGCSIGWIAGTVLSFVPTQEVNVRLFICFALVVFLVATTSFAIFHPGPISYFKKRKAVGEAAVIRSFSNVDSGDLFGQRVQAVADKYSLTARQGEVLCCLAQGRNASYIAQKYTISNHTAKSHIYNIYMKLDVHSQQDLLDIIESIEPSCEIRQGILKDGHCRA